MDNKSENATTRQPAFMRALSPRVTAGLAAAMLAIGAAVGAAIGPAPSASLAGSRIPLLLPSLLGGAGTGPQPSSTAPAQPPAAIAQPTPSATGVATPAPSSAPSPTSAPTSGSPPAQSPVPAETPAGSGGGNAKTLAPVTSVWLIELSGSTFANALAQPTAAPYTVTQAIPTGTLLSGWSALDAGAFANETALLASTPPQLLYTIVQPPCAEGAAGAQCAEGTPGALTAADEFLKATLPTITSTSQYREHGLIVVTFASISAGSASGLPVGSTRATLTSHPPVGALVISPFAAAGRSASSFNPTSPKQSVERLLRR